MTYTFDMKKRLAEKIGKLKTKEHVKMIKDIIFEENKDIAVTKKSNSILMYFHNLTEETYSRIDKYIEKLDKERRKRMEKSISEASKIPITSILSTFSNSEKPDTRSRYRLSNKERSIIKRKEYEREIDGYTSDDIIFNSDTLRSPDVSDNVDAINVFVKKTDAKKK